MGSRATGNDAGCYVAAGPLDRRGASRRQEGFHLGNRLALATYRTQLFNPADIDNVKAIRPSMAPLSAFRPARPLRPCHRLAEDRQVDGAEGCSELLPFLLSFAPATGPAAVEIPLREKFASIGIEAGKPFPTVDLTDADKAAIAEAGKSIDGVIKAKLEKMGKQINGWIVVASGIGDRAVYAGDYARRGRSGGTSPTTRQKPLSDQPGRRRGQASGRLRPATR